MSNPSTINDVIVNLIKSDKSDTVMMILKSTINGIEYNEDLMGYLAKMTSKKEELIDFFISKKDIRSLYLLMIYSPTHDNYRKILKSKLKDVTWEIFNKDNKDSQNIFSMLYLSVPISDMWLDPQTIINFPNNFISFKYMLDEISNTRIQFEKSGKYNTTLPSYDYVLKAAIESNKCSEIIEYIIDNYSIKEYPVTDNAAVTEIYTRKGITPGKKVEEEKVEVKEKPEEIYSMEIKGTDKAPVLLTLRNIEEYELMLKLVDIYKRNESKDIKKLKGILEIVFE